MRILKLALLGGAVFAVTTFGSQAPASASSLIAGLSKGLTGAAGNSPIIFVRGKKKGRGKRGGRGRSRGRNNAGTAAAVVGGAALFLGLINAARINECVKNHDDVDRERGVWYDENGDRHPC